MSGNQERIKLLLNQRDPATLGRLMAYYGYLNEYRAENIEAVTAHIRELAEIRSQVAAEEARLAELARARYAELTELNTTQEKRQQLLASLRDRMADEGREIERQVGHVGERVGRVDGEGRQHREDLLFEHPL